MASWTNPVCASWSALLLLTASPKSHVIPAWLIGDWTTIEVYQNRNMRYLSDVDDPKHWYAGATLSFKNDSFIYDDAKCSKPVVSTQHGRIEGVLRKREVGTLKELGIPGRNINVEYMEFECPHFRRKMASELEFSEEYELGYPITFTIVVRDANTIEMTFLARSYIRLRKVGPVS